MDTKHWNKRTNSSPKIHEIYIKSTTHMRMQQDSRHHNPQTQEYCTETISRKKIYLQSDQTHLENREKTNWSF